MQSTFAVLMRWQTTLVTFSALFFGVTGCATRVSCPEGRAESGDACVCLWPTVDVGGECREPGEPAGAPADAPADALADAGEEPSPPRPRVDGGTRSAPAPLGVDARTPPPTPDPPDPAPIPREPAPDASAAPSPLPPVEPPDEPLPLPDSSLLERCRLSCIQGTCDARGRCVSSSAQCGNGVLDADEECEIGTVFGGWTDLNCTADCKRKLYTVCRTSGDCPADTTCVRGVCSPWTCGVFSIGEQLTPRPHQCARACPKIPSNTNLVDADSCVLRCIDPESPTTCPRGLVCKKFDLDPDLPVEREPYICASEAFVAAGPCTSSPETCSFR